MADDSRRISPRARHDRLPRLKKGSVENLVCLLHELYETSVVPGRFFDTPQHFRVGIGGDSEMTRTAFERLSLALDEYARSV